MISLSNGISTLFWKVCMEPPARLCAMNSFQSNEYAGLYPERPFFSQYRAKTSGRPRNNDANRLTCSGVTITDQAIPARYSAISSSLGLWVFVMKLLIAFGEGFVCTEDYVVSQKSFPQLAKRRTDGGIVTPEFVGVHTLYFSVARASCAAEPLQKLEFNKSRERLFDSRSCYFPDKSLDNLFGAKNAPISEQLIYTDLFLRKKLFGLFGIDEHFRPCRLFYEHVEYKVNPRRDVLVVGLMVLLRLPEREIVVGFPFLDYFFKRYIRDVCIS